MMHYHLVALLNNRRRNQIFQLAVACNGAIKAY